MRHPCPNKPSGSCFCFAGHLKQHSSGNCWQLTELACFLAWLISSLICEMLRLRLSCNLLMGCSFSKSRSASSSKSFTLAPAAWTAQGSGQKKKAQATTQNEAVISALQPDYRRKCRREPTSRVKAEKRCHDITPTEEDVWRKRET